MRVRGIEPPSRPSDAVWPSSSFSERPCHVQLDRLHVAHVSGPSISRTSLMVLEAIVRSIEVGPLQADVGGHNKENSRNRIFGPAKTEGTPVHHSFANKQFADTHSQLIYPRGDIRSG